MMQNPTRFCKQAILKNISFFAVASN